MNIDPLCRQGHPETFSTPPSAPPIYQTTAFDVPDLEALESLQAGQTNGYIYTRDNNPNHSALAATIADMEHAEAGAAFSSGMGAIAAVIMSMVNHGEHVVVSKMLYGRTTQLFGRLQNQFGVQVSLFDPTRMNTLQECVRPESKLCFVETIANPLLEVVNFDELKSVLGDVPLVVDSTFTTPELIQPVTLGAHVVVHSASKYLNGHGDVMLGVAAGPSELMNSALETASIFGQNANPFECWLTQRGLRTLPLRMRQICESTEVLASYLETRPEVARVYHPSVASHTTHEIASRYYSKGFGGIVSFELADGDRDAVNRFMKAASSLPFSPTLADARTTLSHPAATSHRYMAAEDRLAIGIRDGLIRLSVGLEPVELLKQEIGHALESV